MKSISEIKGLLQKINKRDKDILNKIFSFSFYKSEMILPEELKSKFKNPKEMANQEIIRIDNKLTKESSIFNPFLVSLIILPE